jgi:hypothetical protein
MTQTTQGQSITLTSEWAQYPGGPAVDVTGLTVTITAPDSTVDVATTSSGITHPATGVYQYTWAVPAAGVVGDHVVAWAATYGGNPVTASEIVTVLALSTGTWAQLADVTAITGKSVTADQLFQANAIIEMVSGRLYAISATKIGARNAEWLKRAVAYEAAWIPANPDLFQRLDVTGIAEGRKNVLLKDLALIVAPLANRALNRLSWKRSRSMHVHSPFQDGFGPISSDPDSAGNDAYEQWSPL